MKIIIVTYLIIISICAMGVAQSTNNNSVLTKVTNDTVTNLKRLDNELFRSQIEKLKNELSQKNVLFYSLHVLTDTDFVSSYSEKELKAYAFNPPWDRLKSVVKSLDTNFSIWSLSYSQSRVYSETNFLQIKKNFDLLKASIEDILRDNCNETIKCDQIKRKLLSSRAHINNLIIELNKFLQL